MKHIRSLILAALMFAGLGPAFAQAPPPVPALPDTERRTSYVLSASTCACAVGFQLYQDSTDVANWLKVYINGVEIPQSGNWNITSPSGSIGVLSRPISDAVLTFTAARTGTVQIVGAQRPRRLSEFAENRGVAARDLNQALNGIEAQLREMWDRQFRTVQAPPGETLSLLPAAASRLNMGACFDSGGNLSTCASIPSSTLIAGNGITLTGTGPVTVTANVTASAPIVASGTNPIQFSCPTCGVGNVTGSGSPVIGDISAFTNTSATAISGTGYNATQVPGLIPSTATVTISNASPGVITWNSHNLTANAPVFFCTSGALPTGLTACSPASGAVSANTYLSNPTLYYVVGSSITTNTFTVATSIANAKAGVAVNTSSAGSGSHTAFANAMACKGCVGELVWNTVTIAGSVAAVSGSAGQVWNTISLDPGVWEVWGNTGVIKQGAGTPVFSHMHASIVYGFSTIATSPFNSTVASHITSNDPNGWMFANRPEQIFLTATTTINAVATTDFSPTTANTAGFYGSTWARRIK